jgi:hypothetical protein
LADSSLLPVLSALGGVALAQGVAMLQSWLDRQNKREILLRTKYEELGTHFLDSMKLPHDLMKATSTEAILALTHQESANKARLLAVVYFPPLQQSIGQYSDSYSELCLVVTSLYNPQDNRHIGMQVFDKPAYIEARNNHLAARDNLQDQIEFYASTYAKS